MSKPNFSIRKMTEIWPMRCFRGGCTCWFQSTDHQQRLNVPNAMGTSTSPTFYLLIPHTSTHTNCKTRKGTGTFRERDWGFQVRGLGKDKGGGGSVGCCLALISLHLSGAAGIVTVVPSSPLLSPPRQDRLSRSKDWQMATAAKPHHHHHHPCSPSATLSSCSYPPIILMSPPLPYIHTGGRVGRGKEGKEEWRNVWRIRF